MNKESLDKTFLSSICSVNISVLSIFSAVIIVFYFFAYEKIVSLKTDLDSSRHEIESLFINNPSLFWIPLTGDVDIDCRKYFSENKTNYKLLYTLLKATTASMPNPKEREFLKKYDMDYEYSNLSEIDRIGIMISVIHTLTMSNPYSNRAVEVHKYGFSIKSFPVYRDEFTEEWFKGISRFNEILIACKPQIIKSVSWYQEKEESFQSNNPRKNKEEEIRKAHFPYEPWTSDYNYWINTSFKKFEHVQFHLLNKIFSKRSMLKKYQRFNISKIKTDAVYRGTVLLLIGILFPLFLIIVDIYNYKQYFELFILLSSLTVYLETYFHFRALF